MSCNMINTVKTPKYALPQCVATIAYTAKVDVHEKMFYAQKNEKYVKFNRPKGFLISRIFFPSFYTFLKL